MILPLMSIVLLGVALAQDEEIPDQSPIRLDLEEVPLRLSVPRDARGAVGWQWSYFAQSGTELTMSRYKPPSVLVHLGMVAGFQPALERLDKTYILHLLQKRLEMEGDYAFHEDVALRMEEHPILGKVLVADLKAVFTPPLPPTPEGSPSEGAPATPPPPKNVAPPPLPIAMNIRVVVYRLEAGGGVVVTESADALDPARPEVTGLPPEEVVDLAAATEEVLSMITILKPPMADAELPQGRVEMEAGYALTLPEGWRSLTPKEMNAVSTARVPEGPFEGQRAVRVFVEPSTVTPLEFSCQVYATKGRPIEVLHHEKSEEHARNYRTHARVILKGSRFRLSSGGNAEIIAADLPTEILPILVPEAADGDLKTLSLGDRDAYAWRVQGTRGPDEPVTVAGFYTAWDNLGLDCFAIASPGEEAMLDVFDQTMGTLEILESDAHPMVLSFMSRYQRWWPYSHPALQLYWLIVPLFLTALIPMFREWREGRS